mmetsp:Transcript_12172/g.18038  ORF Transcript_12172/g.18038 Transcript_12172/m.18038 type:complete len:376 (-) Transcript_12172:88-1215(-)
MLSRLSTASLSQRLLSSTFSSKMSTHNLEKLDTSIILSSKNMKIAQFSSRSYETPKILVTGANGQVGKELVPYFRLVYGDNNVIASDVNCKSLNSDTISSDQCRVVDVLNPSNLLEVVEENSVNTIIHLAAVLSANGEKNPMLAIKINNDGTQNVLEIARKCKLKVFCPSSIAVFGPQTEKYRTPNCTITRPTTIYGLTKVHTELLGEYYHNKFGVDFRSLRYPGVISTKAMPGGGTTDYAVEVFYDAIEKGQYTCYLRKDTELPMIYMPDLLRGTSDFLSATSAELTSRTYNLGAMSFTPGQLESCIKQHFGDFDMFYSPDFRQDIADSWPRNIDSSDAERDWGWKPHYDLDAMVHDIVHQFLPEYRTAVPSEL